MMHFDSDYMNTAHPLVMQRLSETMGRQFTGYGTDEITLAARERIRDLCGCPEADVHFLCGGTQTNMVVIDFLLRSFEGVLAADCGHIAVHESGAIEFTGHKVLPLPHENGKVTAAQVDEYVRNYYSDPNWEHIVPPGMVYITHPTEYGTVYTLDELEALSAVCRGHNIPLYLDGARLGYGIAIERSKGEEEKRSKVDLKDIARLCDAFYIGGTKCGAMFGEAVVLPRPKADNRFFTHIKRHGALIAKGWLVAAQFDALLSPHEGGETLYHNICRHAVREAMRLREALKTKGYTMPIDSPTNQQFVELSMEQAAELKRHLSYGEWEPPHNGRVVIRLATSWATKPEDVERLIELL